MRETYICGALSLVATLAMGACADGDASIRILRNQLPGANCALDANTTGEFISRGVIDASAQGGYLFTPLVENRTEPSEAGDADRAFFIAAANIDISFTNEFYSDGELAALSDSGLTRFRQPLSGSILAGESRPFSFEIIPTALLEDLGSKLADGESTTLIVDIEIVGDVASSDVSSEVFSYPVDVCVGCLQNDLGACADFTGEVDNVGGSCQLLQDGFIDCCRDPDGALVCPASAPSEEEPV